MIRRTLMRRNQELVDFEIDPATSEVRVLAMLAPEDEVFACVGQVQQGLDKALGRLIKRRSLSFNRPDVKDVIAACGAQSAIDLVFRGHGLSLSDLFWYRSPGSAERWEDINFFDNNWDAGFGAAVLSGDYASLVHCSPDVPEATTPGHAPKAWERNDEGTFLVKVSERFGGAELMGSKLASEVCAKLFEEGQYVPLSTVERYGRPCSSSPLMLAADEELVDGDRIRAIVGGQATDGESSLALSETFDALIDVYESAGIADASTHMARLSACSCLILLADFHPGNIGAIRSVDTGAWRAAPIFDYDGSFGFPFDGFPILSLCKQPGLAAIFCARSFSYLQSSWDWSWYDPRALEGFENRIVEAYAPYPDLPPNFAELVARLFADQLKYTNKIASAQD